MNATTKPKHRRLDLDTGEGSIPFGHGAKPTVLRFDDPYDGYTRWSWRTAEIILANGTVWSEAVRIWEHPAFEGFPDRDDDHPKTIAYRQLDDAIRADWIKQSNAILDAHNDGNHHIVVVDCHS